MATTRSCGSTLRKGFCAASLFLVGFMGAARADEITIMGYSDAAFQDNFIAAIIKPFMAAHPDIKVNFYPVPNAATALGLMRAQKGDPQSDLAIYDIGIASIGKQEDLLAPFDTAKMPHYGELNKIGQELGAYAIPFTYDTLGIAYLASAFPQAPTSLQAMWDPSVKGKVIVSAASDIQATAFTIVTDKMMGETDFMHNLEPAYKKLVELAPQVQTWAPKPDQYTLLANGSASISTGWNARNQIYARLTQGKVNAFTPAEGTVAQINVLSFIKGSKHAESARLFADYAISPETQARFSTATFYSPTNTKVDLPEEVKAHIPLMNADIAKNLINVDWIAASQKRQDVLAVWKRRIIAASR